MDDRPVVAGGDWGSWSALGGALLRPALVVGNTAGGNIQLFGVDAQGRVWSRWQGASGGWSPWTDFGGRGLRLARVR